jgi:hypothetical protein
MSTSRPSIPSECFIVRRGAIDEVSAGGGQAATRFATKAWEMHQLRATLITQPYGNELDRGSGGNGQGSDYDYD